MVGFSPKWMLKLWLRALAPFMPRAGFRCGLLEEKDLFTDLFSTPSLPSALEMLLSTDPGNADSKGSPLAKLSRHGGPSEAAVLLSPEVSRLAGSLESSGLDLLKVTELLEASFKLSFSCFPGTMDVFLSN